MAKIPSWKAKSYSAMNEIPACLEQRPTHPIPSQMNPVQNFSPVFLKIFFHTTIVLTPLSSKVVSFHKFFLLKLCVHFSSPHLWYMSRPSDSPNNI